MYVGVDVGGTYTDAVLLDEKRVLATAKVPTKSDLLGSIIRAIDIVLKDVQKKHIKRIVFSTTIITNLIAEHKYDDVALLLIPGPGLSRSYYNFNAEAVFLSGAIDYRGREIIPLNPVEVKEKLSQIAAKGYKKVGVICKFSTRNTSYEKQVAAMIREKYPEWQVESGSQVAGQLNFPRRVVTTHLTCATREPYSNFAKSVRQALEIREIKADVFILKADGGTLPLQSSEEFPVETIFSGPAASTLGVQALTKPGETAVVVDIGGTTTDLALILGGRPLLSSKGAKVMEQLTQVRTLAVKSVAIGGDSLVVSDGENLIINPERMGSAYCMGGPAPTPTDALRTLGLTSLGDGAKAREAMTRLGNSIGIVCEEVAWRIIKSFVDKVSAEIENIFFEWEQEPAYRVWEVLQKRRIRPELVVGVGGGTPGFINQIAEKIGCKPYIPPYAPVANAIGAAVAKPTMQTSLRADTEQGYYIIQEEGLQEKIEDSSFNESNALELAKKKLIERSSKYGLEVSEEEIEITRQEVFNMIRDWHTTGRLFDITVQTPRGIICRIGAEDTDEQVGR